MLIVSHDFMVFFSFINWSRVFYKYFRWVISRTSNLAIVTMAMQFTRKCIEFVNITFKQETLGLNEMYLQSADDVA